MKSYYQSYEHFMEKGILALKIKGWSFRQLDRIQNELFRVDTACYLWTISPSIDKDPKKILLWN